MFGRDFPVDLDRSMQRAGERRALDDRDVVRLRDFADAARQLIGAFSDAAFVLDNWADLAERMVNGRSNGFRGPFCHQSAVYHKNPCAAALGGKNAHSL